MHRLFIVILVLDQRKFADAFTRNFDLVAERKSVVFHLRELAKASVMAKYLVDSNIRVSSSWYQLADEMLGCECTAPHRYRLLRQKSVRQ